MSKSEELHIRVDPKLKRKLKFICGLNSVKISIFIREAIKEALKKA